MADLHDATGTRSERERIRRILTASAEPTRPRDAATASSDPELDRIVERQRHVALLLAGGGPDTPGALRARLEELHAQPRDRRLRALRAFRVQRPRWAFGVPAAAAAALAALIVLLSAGASSSVPSAGQFASIWTRPQTGAPLRPDPNDPADLDVAFHGTAYPNYHDEEGWHPAGTRSDRIAGRSTFTVYYETGDRRAAYTVVAGPGVSIPSSARRFVVGGLRLAEFRDHNKWIVVFRDHGNSCVLTAAAPRERQWLVKLAVWRERRSTTAPA